MTIAPEISPDWMDACGSPAEMFNTVAGAERIRVAFCQRRTTRAIDAYFDAIPAERYFSRDGNSIEWSLRREDICASFDYIGQQRASLTWRSAGWQKQHPAANEGGRDLARMLNIFLPEGEQKIAAIGCIVADWADVAKASGIDVISFDLRAMSPDFVANDELHIDRLINFMGLMMLTDNPATAHAKPGSWKNKDINIGRRLPLSPSVKTALGAAPNRSFALWQGSDMPFPSYHLAQSTGGKLKLACIGSIKCPIALL